MEERFKFRFWNIKEKVIHDDILLFFDYTDCMNDENLIPMQCTGLKDKNGKLIFEGDILFYKIGSIKCREVVTWNQQRCGWVKGYQDLCTYQKHCEVIGNIYENANLLEEKCLN